MISFNTKYINPGALYRVTTTDPIDSTAKIKTMTGADLKEIAFAIGHLYDMDAELIPAEPEAPITETTETAEQTTETALDALREGARV